MGRYYFNTVSTAVLWMDSQFPTLLPLECLAIEQFICNCPLVGQCMSNSSMIASVFSTAQLLDSAMYNCPMDGQ